jgi:branched-chain amino acid transport system permease protein
MFARATVAPDVRPRGLFGPVLLALCLVLLAGNAEAKPPSEPWQICRTLLTAFELTPRDLVSDSRIGAPSEPSALRFDWFRREADGNNTAHFLVCYFLPLDASNGRWQVAALDNDSFGHFERYDIQQLYKLIHARLRSSDVEKETGDPDVILWLHVAQQAINALSLGALYGLIAIGFTLAYAASGVMNLALGTLFTFGAFQAFFAYLLGEAWFGQGWLAVVLVGLLLSLVAGATAGYASWKAAFAPLARRVAGPQRGQAALVVATGLLIALQEALRLGQGPKTRWLPYRSGNAITLAEEPGYQLVLSRGHLIVFLCSLTLALLLAWYLRRTRAGLSLRAVADDPRAAALLGVSVARTTAGAFLLSGALAGVAGGFAFLHYGAVNFHLGLITGFKALTATLLGGIGSVGGALLAGFLVAFVEAIAVSLGQSLWKDLWVFALLVGVLVFRPNGLFGRESR